MDETDLEIEYEEKTLEEFKQLIDDFQKNHHNMDSTSMIRLLIDVIDNYTNKIDVLGK